MYQTKLVTLANRLLIMTSKMEHVRHTFCYLTKNVPKSNRKCSKLKTSETMEVQTFYQTKTVVSSFNVSLMTLRRTVEFLRVRLGADVLDKEFGERGYSQRCCDILKLYFQFRNQGMGRERAANTVKQLLQSTK